MRAEPEVGTVQVNGRAVALPAGAAVLQALLVRLGFAADRPGIAVALNGRVVPRKAWPAQPVQAGDAIEVVSAVQGG
jgi:sulfur carrier protein